MLVCGVEGLKLLPQTHLCCVQWALEQVTEKQAFCQSFERTELLLKIQKRQRTIGNEQLDSCVYLHVANTTPFSTRIPLDLVFLAFLTSSLLKEDSFLLRHFSISIRNEKSS